MKKINILSIDFDYFQKVDNDTISECYPDGVDLPEQLSNVIWASHYSTSQGKLQNVECDKEKLQQMKNIISQSSGEYVCMIVNSHKYIHPFIMDSVNGQGEDVESVNIEHVDMHHDVTNDSSELDCGNWISYLKESLDDADTDMLINWTCNPVTKEAYGITEEDEFFSITDSLDEIEGKKFDRIFLCRSGQWVPPHLDKDFMDLAEFIKDNSRICVLEENIISDRYEKENFQESLQAVNNVYKEINNFVESENKRIDAEIQETHNKSDRNEENIETEDIEL